MKKLVVFFLMACFIFSIVTNIMAKGSITSDKLTISVDESKTEIFTVTADYAAGRIDIKVTDESIASVDVAKHWLDVSSVDVTVTGLKAGKTTIIVKLTDISDYDGNEMTGEIVIDLTVNGKQTANNDKEDSNHTGLLAGVGATVAIGGVGAYAVTKKKKQEN